MSYELYPVSVKDEGRTRFLIWCDDQSGNHYLRDGDDLIVGDSLDALRNMLAEKSKEVDWGSSCVIDLDHLLNDFEAVSIEHTSGKNQNSLFLDVWNFFEDLIRTFELEQNFSRFRTPCLDKVYEKIFWGCNLPAVTPEGKSYSPLWADSEIEAWREYMCELRRVFVPKIFRDIENE